MTRHLFVYGSLRKGVRNSRFSLLARDVRFVGLAKIRGRLCDLGAYPGLILPKDGDGWVRGELYALSNAGEVLARLDVYEGCGPQDPRPHEFERVAVEITLDDGTMRRAWVYEYKGDTKGKPEIASGDYADAAV